MIDGSCKFCIKIKFDLNKGIDVAESNNSKECIVLYYWCFSHGFTFQNSACNDCHDLTMLCFNNSETNIITVKGVNYCCIVHDIDDCDYI